MKIIYKMKVKNREFLIIEKSKNYYSVSYFDYPMSYLNNTEEVEITSANSKSKAKNKLKLIVKSYELGFNDGWE